MVGAIAQPSACAVVQREAPAAGLLAEAGTLGGVAGTGNGPSDPG